MTQFTSSAKPIQHFCETQLINKLADAVGDRLERLEQIERQQLLMCLSTWVYSVHVHRLLDKDEDVETPLENYRSSIAYQGTKTVIACLIMLEDEQPDNIAAILPAIAEYANNKSMQKSDSQEMFDDLHNLKLT